MPFVLVPHLEPGVLYPGGAHVTWGKSRPPELYRPEVEYGHEPANAKQQRARDRAEEKQRIKAGERLHPLDPADPWSGAVWSPCLPDCTIHHH